MAENKEFQLTNRKIQEGSEHQDGSEFQQATFELLEQLDELSAEQKEFISNLSVQDQEILTALALEIAFTEEEGNGGGLEGAPSSPLHHQFQDDPESQELLQKILLKASMEEECINQDGGQSSSTVKFMNALAQKVDLLANQNQHYPLQEQVTVAESDNVLQMLATSDSTLDHNVILSAPSFQSATADPATAPTSTLITNLTTDQIVAAPDDIAVGSKEHALFALYVAHYQKEALKLASTPNAAASDLQQDLTLNNIAVKVEQGELQQQMASAQYASSTPMSSLIDTDQLAAASNAMGISPGMLVPEATQTELEQLMLIQAAMASQQQQPLSMDITEIEAMNAVMQEALQAAANTMALNEALSAAAAAEPNTLNLGGNGNGGGNTLDLNGIDLTGIDLENFDFSNIDFSNIDLANVDFSQMDYCGIDYSRIDMNQVDMSLFVDNVGINGGGGGGDDEVTTFDLDAQSALGTSLNMNMGDAEVNVKVENDFTTAKVAKEKKEKKERKPAAPKEPKPPRVKAPQGPQICPTCLKTFKSRKTLTLHERSHAAVKPYPCLEPGCSSSFAQKSHLNAHKLTHSGERPYKCTLCDACYTTPSRRNEHMRSHTRETKYICKECDMKFRNVTNYKNHMASHLPKDQRPNKKWYCQQCEAVYAQRTSLIRHRNKMHPKSPEQIEQERLLKEQKRAEKLSKKSNGAKRIIITTPGSNIDIAASAAIAAIAAQGLVGPSTSAGTAVEAKGESGSQGNDSEDMDELDIDDDGEMMEEEGMDVEEDEDLATTIDEVIAQEA